jgi:ribosome biogenesis GTPase
LLLVHDGGSAPVVILNKADLCEDIPGCIDAVQAVCGSDVPVHALSALDKDSIRVISAHLQPGTTVAFMGSSGVGKSTIVNGLMSTAVAETGDVREFDGRGRHTTTHREMFRLASGGVLIDTPGMREIQPWSGGNGLSRAFEDIEKIMRKCRFNDCSHRSEPGCAVLDALDNGQLDSDRWQSYLKLQREEAFLEREKNRKARMKEQKRWKDITRNMRQRRKIDPKFMD